MLIHSDRIHEQIKDFLMIWNKIAYSLKCHLLWFASESNYKGHVYIKTNCLCLTGNMFYCKRKRKKRSLIENYCIGHHLRLDSKDRVILSLGMLLQWALILSVQERIWFLLNPWGIALVCRLPSERIGLGWRHP
jgi:hypothetical protein